MNSENKKIVCMISLNIVKSQTASSFIYYKQMKQLILIFVVMAHNIHRGHKIHIKRPCCHEVEIGLCSEGKYNIS